MMYNEERKDYTLNRALEMIHMDQENRADDYLCDGGSEGWLDFLADPGLTFFLTGEGSIPFGLTLSKVLESQFGELRIDLALAYALMIRNGCDAPDPESFGIAKQIGLLLCGLEHCCTHPVIAVSKPAQQKQLFKVYQVRRRLRYAFRNFAADPDFAPAWDAHRFLRTSLLRIQAYLESHMPEEAWPLTGGWANAAVEDLVGYLEEEAGYGYFLRCILYRKGVLVWDPDDDSEDDDV